VAFNVNDFRNRGLRFGGARPTLFRVLIDNPIALPGIPGGLRELSSFTCQASSIPASVISPINVPYFGRDIKVAGNREFEPWSVNVMNDEDFRVRGIFEAWHSGINTMQSNVQQGSGQPSDYKVRAEVQQLAKIGPPSQIGASTPFIRQYTLEGAFPISIGPIELSWEAKNQIEVFNVTFAYDFFTVQPGNVSGVTNLSRVAIT
jgi:hypothetical protein